MDAHILRLRFHSALHTGRRGIGSEETDHRLAADTVFAALITQCAQRSPELVEALISPFPRRDRNGGYLPGDPPFRLSSCFPFAGEQHLFPVPMGNLGASVDKMLKKVVYVSGDIFSQMLKGETLDKLREQVVILQGGKVWVGKAESRTLPKVLRDGGDIWRDRQRPRVWVERQTNASTIFHHGEVFFNDGCGLWFAFEWRDPTIKPRIEALWMDLQALGIGGLRGYGLGAFSSEEGGELNLPESAVKFVSLSRIHPAPDDLRSFKDGTAAYRLSQVGGYMSVTGGKDVNRRTVTLVEEGAVLPVSVQGCLVDVSPPNAPHPSWRYGLAFPAGMGS